MNHHICHVAYAPATARVLDGLLNELGDGLRFELGVRTEREGACNQTERDSDKERHRERERETELSLVLYNISVAHCDSP